MGKHIIQLVENWPGLDPWYQMCFGGMLAPVILALRRQRLEDQWIKVIVCSTVSLKPVWDPWEPFQKQKP